MAATQLGTDLLVGAGNVAGNYFVESIESGDADVKFTDYNDENGKLATRVIKDSWAKKTLNLVCKSGATPATDFPVGAMATLSGFTTYFVDSCSITASEDATKVTVQLSAIGIS